MKLETCGQGCMNSYYIMGYASLGMVSYVGVPPMGNWQYWRLLVSVTVPHGLEFSGRVVFQWTWKIPLTVRLPCMMRIVWGKWMSTYMCIQADIVSMHTSHDVCMQMFIVYVLRLTSWWHTCELFRYSFLVLGKISHWMLSGIFSR